MNDPLYQLHKIFLTSNNIKKDLEALNITKTLPSYLIVNRNNKIMHRIRAQLEGLEKDGNEKLANEIVAFILEKEKDFLKYLLSNKEKRFEKIFPILSLSIDMDAYLLARMFRNYKSAEKPHIKPNKVIVFAGQAHIQNYVEFFEEKLGTKFSKYGITQKNEDYLKYPTVKKCVQISKEDFNDFLLPIQQEVKSERKYKQPMQRYLTGYVDADRNILLNTNEKELLLICVPPVNQYSEKLCNESFWYNRLKIYYPDTIKNKTKGTWKNYAMNMIHYKSKLEENYNFEFSKGDPRAYYKILSGKDTGNSKARKAARIGALNLIEFLNSKGEITDFNYILLGAAEGNHPNVIKYAEENGANDWNSGLQGAADGWNVSLIDYFVKKGADDWNRGLIGAASGGNLSLIDFFVKKGANAFEEAIKAAASSGHLNVVKHLENSPGIEWNDVIIEAAEEGHMNIIKYLSNKPNIDWEEIYEIGQEIEKNDIIQFAEEKIRNAN